MRGRTLFIGFGLFIVAFAAGLYYANSYAYYDETSHETLTLSSEAGEIALKNVRMIDAETTPLKLRICAGQIDGSGLAPAEEATPLVAPSWFDCFDAGALSEGIEAGAIQAFILKKNQPFGFTEYIATDDVHSWVWRQINECGEAKFEGDPLPEGCEEN